MDVPDNVENPQGMETVLKALAQYRLTGATRRIVAGLPRRSTTPTSRSCSCPASFTDAVARGANCIVATCPLCQFNVDAYQAAWEEIRH